MKRGFLMKHIYPLYFEKFRCIAGKCPDTCCAGWEIVVDEKFQKLYKENTSQAARDAAESMYTDEDGDVCLRLNDGRCPMLNDDNLCRLYIDIGEHALCDVCRIYPRFNKEADDIVFSGISLSCPEAARLILEDKSPGGFNSDNLADAGYTKDISDIYLCLRERIISGSLFDISLIYEEIEDAVFFGDIKKACSLAEKPCDPLFLPETKDVLDIAKELSGFEILTDEWKKLLSNLPIHLEKAEKDKAYLEKRNKALLESASFNETKNIAIYFLYKYMPEAIYDGDTDAMIKMTYLSLCIICEIYAMEIMETKNFPFERKLRIAQLFSKEIEHNEDNLEKII